VTVAQSDNDLNEFADASQLSALGSKIQQEQIVGNKVVIGKEQRLI
jgi:hypothetical protein